MQKKVMAVALSEEGKGGFVQGDRLEILTLYICLNASFPSLGLHSFIICVNNFGCSYFTFTGET